MFTTKTLTLVVFDHKIDQIGVEEFHSFESADESTTVGMPLAPLISVDVESVRWSHFFDDPGIRITR